MKKMLFVFMMSLFFLPAFGSAGEDPVKTIKYGFLDIGVQENPSCAVTNLFMDIANKEGLKIRWVTGKLEQAAADMENQLFDVSAHGISNINSAAPHFALASKPYLKVTRGFTVLKNSTLAKSNSLPQGARVGVMENSTALQDIEKNYPAQWFNLTIIDKLEGTARGMLRAGTINAIAEGYTGFWFNPDDAKDLTMIDIHPLDKDRPDSEGLVFWVQQDEGVLLNKINGYMNKLEINIYKHYQQNEVCDTDYVFPENHTEL